MIVVNSRFLTQKISGVQRYAIEISKRLKDIRPDIKFIAPKNIIHKEVASELKAETYGQLTGHLWEQFDLQRYLWRQGKNALLICLANTAPLFYKNKVVTIHDVAFLANPTWYSRRFYYFYYFLIPRIARNARMVITDSRFSSDEIGKHINLDQDKINVIPCGISPKFLSSKDMNIDNKTGRYILAVSTLDPRKNFERIVNAFLKMNLPDLKLVIIGSMHKNFAKTPLIKQIENDNRVLLIDCSGDDELIGYYKNAELFIYPSLYEGFGLPPLEAMACGCPCVVSRAASLPEICGDAVLYCDPYSTDDIADKMMHLLNDKNLQADLIRKGFEQIKKFDWGKTAETFLSLVDKITLDNQAS